MSKSAGPTETRVRAALLRRWKREPESTQEKEWDSDLVCGWVMLDGEGGLRWKVYDAVQRVGRNVAKGKCVDAIGTTGWAALDEDAEYTYERGVFRVRARPESTNRKSRTVADEQTEAAEPDFVRDWTKVIADTTIGSTRRDRVPSMPELPPGYRVGECEGGDWIIGDGDGWFDDDRWGELQATREDAVWLAWHHFYDYGDRQWVEFIESLRAASGASLPTAPRVTQRQVDMMRHATGGKLRCVRNYAFAVDDDDRAVWYELVAMGLAGEGEPPDCSEAGQRKGITFHVTEAGFRMAYGDVRKPKRGKR